MTGPNAPTRRKKNWNQIEKEIPKLERRKKEILHLFNMGDLTPAEAASLSVELGEVQTTLEEKEMRWLELSE